MGKQITLDELKQKPESDLVVDYIVKRKREGLYSLTLTAGLPGSGKTSTCCRIAELVSLKILGENIMKKENIVDSFLDFVKFVRDAEPDKLNLCVIEEVSVLFPSRRAMSGDNVDLGKVLDTCRKKQVVVFASAPIWTSIDSHMRSMANVYIQTIKVYKTAGIVYSKFYRLQTDPRTGKTYTHSFHRNNRDVTRMYTLQSDKKEWDKYENMKDKFMDDIYTKAHARALDRQRKDEKLVRKAQPNNMEGFTSQELRIFDAVTLKGRRQVDVGNEEGVTQSRISQIISKINKMKENL